MLLDLNHIVQSKMKNIAKLSHQGLTTPNFIQHVRHFRDGSKSRVLNMNLSVNLDNQNEISHLRQINTSHNMTKIEISRIEFGNHSSLNMSSMKEIGQSVMTFFKRKTKNATDAQKNKMLPDDI